MSKNTLHESKQQLHVSEETDADDRCRAQSSEMRPPATKCCCLDGVKNFCRLLQQREDIAPHCISLMVKGHDPPTHLSFFAWLLYWLCHGNTLTIRDREYYRYCFEVCPNTGNVKRFIMASVYEPVDYYNFAKEEHIEQCLKGFRGEIMQHNEYQSNDQVKVHFGPETDYGWSEVELEPVKLDEVRRIPEFDEYAWEWSLGGMRV